MEILVDIVLKENESTEIATEFRKLIKLLTALLWGFFYRQLLPPHVGLPGLWLQDEQAS